MVEDSDVRILCDPWLVDGEYYGSWYHYPPLEFHPEEFNDVDFIYISHVHPDHFSRKTLLHLDKDIPVIIHKFESGFLKNNIEKLGFKVMELRHNYRAHLKNGLNIRILSADNCDPRLCSKFFGCGSFEPKLGLTSLDTMCVIDNGEHNVVNTNDCPYDLSYSALQIIKGNYPDIDFLLVGYSGAGPYPQCFNMNVKEIEVACKNKKQEFLAQAEMYINVLKPKFYMPFAGRYTLAGKLNIMNDNRGLTELEEAASYLSQSDAIDQKGQKCVILNQNAYFDLETGRCSKTYTAINLSRKRQYIIEVLSKIKYDYESDPIPSIEDLKGLIAASYLRFESRRREIGFSSDTIALIELSSDLFVALAFNGDGYKFVSRKECECIEKYIKISVDKRLLKRILLGPIQAHWNNAEIGSHIAYERKPNIFERGAYHCINFFHC